MALHHCRAAQRSWSEECVGRPIHDIFKMLINSPARIEGHEVFRSPWSDILPVHAVEGEWATCLAGFSVLYL